MDTITNIAGAASRLGVTRETVSRWIRDGKIRHFVRMSNRCVFINLTKEFPELF